MAVAAFVVSCVGLIVAALALGWQIASWLLDGRRVRVSLVYGLHAGHGAYTAKIKRGGALPDVERIRRQGYDGKAVLGIVVTNVGRATVRIQNYSLGLASGGWSVTPVADGIGPALPFRLPAGESETWYVDVADAPALLAAARTVHPGIRGRFRMSVELGTGDVKATRASARI